MLGRLRTQETAWRPPPYASPPAPWTEGYVRAHRRFVADALQAEDLLQRMREGSVLPTGYGTGLDERVVEWPWLLAHQRGGPSLDAGSVLNHRHVLEVFLEALAPLHVLTLLPEPENFPERGISYIYADLRDMPLRDGRFKTVVCASTLEHIGMDNARYGGAATRAPDPDGEVGRALDELRRVTAPDGTLLMTVPFGRAEDHGWFRQFDLEGLDALLDRSGMPVRDVTVYAYGVDGWQLASPAAAAGLGYHDAARRRVVADDGAAAARAVACVRLRWS